MRTVFLHQPEEAAIYTAMHARGRGFDQHGSAQQRPVVHGSWLYGEWLRAEAERYGLPVIPARPHDTLLPRVLAVLKQ